PNPPKLEDHAYQEPDHSLPEPPVRSRPESTIEPKPLHDFAPTPAAPKIALDIKIDTASIRASHESISDPQTKLDALSKKYSTDAPHAHFSTAFTNIVFGEGDPIADLMFVGEAPGEQEDQTGRPFVGRAGELLEKMIIAMGFTRESVYITNVLKTRPPNNATPTPDQAHLCAPYLIEQIRIINPKVIVTLGLPATHLLLGSTQPMRAMRGRFHPFPSPAFAEAALPAIDLMPTYHPAFLLRAYTEDNRRKVWSDLSMVVERLGLKGP
ncbi:MAG: uracil-DNA glycosylase, partial [Phycisphaerales bacterium]|nr:uracil-DNA glycosylase [Phycisphaerales bacterium]